ncbi:MAG: HAMP domain-containing protein [Gammaproteobacteria bacterium]|nr:HAMP domain-containing protein [Gammaproteobacteria bacterium]MBU2240656.1 HAMP domain-containing protein [Gammaproteobacteria bacterium]MBU2318127.1 HAMP domain-containing protein [Gammaproteobacteria bacterium]MBU2412261.1 HAMP domain-containing protein [Gammaproteobacteria bacterium]
MALVGLMFAFIYLTFSTGFNQFIEQEEQKHVDAVKQQLIELYSQSNSWQPIEQNTLLWRSIVEQNVEPGVEKDPSLNGGGESAKDRQAKGKQDSPSPAFLWINLTPGSLKTGQRISLYDVNKQVIVGRAHLSDSPQVESILLNNNVIGWIGFAPSRLVESSPAKAFLKAQFYSYFMITLCVMLVAFIVAIVLSRHLMKPIRQIVAGTNALKKGNFTNRIPILTQDELGTLSMNVNELAQTLEENQQMRAKWVSDTSHELRTPLTVLRSHLLAVQDGVFVPDEKRIALLIKQVDNLNHIVDDLTQLAYSDAVILTYNLESLDILEAFKSSLDDFSMRFEQQGLLVHSQVLETSEQCIIKGDKDRLQQLFVNLLENSCKYTNHGGQLNIEIKKTASHIELALQDSAPSVSPEDQEKLFERFYRVEKSRNRALGGSGLGLALCKQIVDAHNGEIFLQDSPLGGLAVQIRFPVLEK